MKAQTSARISKWMWCRQTFEARFFITIVLAATFYFIAGNTGSGWIYLLSASLAASVIMALFLPVWQVNNVRVDLNVQGTFTAGEKARINVHLEPVFKFIPVRWLRIYCTLTGTAADSRQFVALEALDEPMTLSWSTEPLKRGIHNLGAVTLASSFPIGYAWWRRRFVESGKTITVYPKTARIDGSFLYKLQPSLAGSGGACRGRQTARQSTSARGIREYVRGDSPRIIHWASTARTGKLQVREFESEGLPHFDVLLDLSAAWESQDQFELAVIAAGSLLSLGHRLGLAPQLLLNPALDTSALALPAVPPGMEMQMEILTRVNPLRLPGKQESGTLSGGTAARALVAIGPQNHDHPHLTNGYLVVIASTSAKDSDNSASKRSNSELLYSLIRNEADMLDL